MSNNTEHTVMMPASDYVKLKNIEADYNSLIQSFDKHNDLLCDMAFGDPILIKADFKKMPKSVNVSEEGMNVLGKIVPYKSVKFEY